MKPLKLELNIALLPNRSLAERLTDLSQTLAENHPTVVRLGRAGARLTLAPHLTLLQTALPLSAIPNLDDRISQIASKTSVFNGMEATKYVYNHDEASFEVCRRVTDHLVAAQTAIIQSVSPLRSNLLVERDPAGNKLEDLLYVEGILGDNIHKYGYAEVGDPRQGGLFRPHDTTNWFELGTQIDINTELLPKLEALRGDYNALGLFILGPHGTCPQLLADYPLIP